MGERLHRIRLYNSPVGRAARRKDRRVVKNLMRSLRRQRPPRDKSRAGFLTNLISQNDGSRGRALRSLARWRDTSHDRDPERRARDLARTGWLEFWLRNEGPWSPTINPKPPPRGPGAGERALELPDTENEWRISAGKCSGPPPPKIERHSRSDPRAALTRNARCRDWRDVADNRKFTDRFAIGRAGAAS